MIKTTIAAAALLLAGVADTAQAGEYRYSDANRAYSAYYDRRPDRGPVEAQPPHPTYQQRFGAFSAANMARNLGF